MKLNHVSSYLSLTAVFIDDDGTQEFEVQACNGTFAGTADVWIHDRELPALVEQLKGFPKTIAQEEKVTFSDPGRTKLIQLTFRCVNGVGYSAVEVVLANGNQRVEMGLGFQPSEMDDFCRELAAVAEKKYRLAVLGTIS